MFGKQNTCVRHDKMGVYTVHDAFLTSLAVSAGCGPNTTSVQQHSSSGMATSTQVHSPAQVTDDEQPTQTE